jgi:hypothetical protein
VLRKNIWYPSSRLKIAEVRPLFTAFFVVVGSLLGEFLSPED